MNEFLYKKLKNEIKREITAKNLKNKLVNK
jgi:hypothetical protein